MAKLKILFLKTVYECTSTSHKSSIANFLELLDTNELSLILFSFFFGLLLVYFQRTRIAPLAFYNEFIICTRGGRGHPWIIKLERRWRNRSKMINSLSVHNFISFFSFVLDN